MCFGHAPHLDSDDCAPGRRARRLHGAEEGGRRLLRARHRARPLGTALDSHAEDAAQAGGLKRTGFADAYRIELSGGAALPGTKRRPAHVPTEIRRARPSQGDSRPASWREIRRASFAPVADFLDPLAPRSAASSLAVCLRRLPRSTSRSWTSPSRSCMRFRSPAQTSYRSRQKILHDVAEILDADPQPVPGDAAAPLARLLVQLDRFVQVSRGPGAGKPRSRAGKTRLAGSLRASFLHSLRSKLSSACAARPFFLFLAERAGAACVSAPDRPPSPASSPSRAPPAYRGDRPECEKFAAGFLELAPAGAGVHFAQRVGHGPAAPQRDAQIVDVVRIPIRLTLALLSSTRSIHTSRPDAFWK